MSGHSVMRCLTSPSVIKGVNTMDPNACLNRFINALYDRDLEEADAAREDLMGWITSGGFEPDWRLSPYSLEDLRNWFDRDGPRDRYCRNVAAAMMASVER